MAKHQAPRTIGRYEVRRELGRGTMGVVYEAWDPTLGRKAALKTVGAFWLSKARRRTYEERFLTEAQAAARLSHPGIVVVHDVGRDAESGLLFMALEYLDGETLADRIESGRRFEWREALRIIGRVAEALHHAHAQGVVHRDIKPANVLILRSGEPKILDFGIARVDSGHLTTPGELFGTPLYMAPEQALGQPADARSDLFSLGTIAYTLLTGEAPFAAPSVPAILARVAHRSAPPPSEVQPALPPDVDDVLARAMAKAPEDRYPSGQMLAEDIEDVLAGRPPRHRAAWTPPAKGERTIISGGPDGGMPALRLADDASAAAPRRGRWRSRLERLALAALAAAAVFHFSVHPEDGAYWLRAGREAHRRLTGLIPPATLEPQPAATSPAPILSAAPSAPEPSPSSETGPPPPAGGAADGSAEAPADVRPASSSDTEAAGQSGAASPGPRDAGSEASEHPQPEPATGEPLAPEATAPEPTPTPPSPAESSGSGHTTTPPAPSSPPRPSAKPPSPTPAVAWLSIGFEHHLPSGTLEVWVDGKRVVKEALDTRVTRRLLGFEVRKGSVRQTLSLRPGRHEVRVRLRSGDDDKVARTSALFRTGATRRLEVTAPRLRGGLTVEWK